MNIFVYTLTPVWDLVKRFNLMIPCVARCSVLSRQDLDPTVMQGTMVRVDHYTGLTALQSIRRGLIRTLDEKRPIVVFTIDRYFVGHGFKPQFMFSSELLKDHDDSEGTSIMNILIFDGMTNITPDSTLQMPISK